MYLRSLVLAVVTILRIAFITQSLAIVVSESSIDLSVDVGPVSHVTTVAFLPVRNGLGAGMRTKKVVFEPDLSFHRLVVGVYPGIVALVGL